MIDVLLLADIVARDSTNNWIIAMISIKLNWHNSPNNWLATTNSLFRTIVISFRNKIAHGCRTDVNRVFARSRAECCCRCFVLVIALCQRSSSKPGLFVRYQANRLQNKFACVDLAVSCIRVELDALDEWPGFWLAFPNSNKTNFILSSNLRLLQLLKTKL